jgi:uncharacterized protein
LVRAGLLDVNALIALLWEEHPFHKSCAAWFSSAQKSGWATCALTQTGFVRLVCNPSFTSRPPSVHAAIALLNAATESTSAHHFWSDDPPLSEIANLWKPPLGHKQVTDAYLLNLAARHKGALVTFDQRIRALAGMGALGADALILLKP